MDVSIFEAVVIEETKITEYLLNVNHPEGRSKAEYFLQHGFDIGKPEKFHETLMHHLQQHPAISKETKFGEKYIIIGKVKSPDGVELMLRSVWIKPEKENILKFVTAYPVENDQGI